MSHAIARRFTPGSLVLLPIACLAALLAARDALGIEADPLKVMAVFFACVAVLLVAARHPAAFVAPVLFTPRLKEIGALSEFGPLSTCTALQVACILLGAGIGLRWLFTPPREEEPVVPDLFEAVPAAPLPERPALALLAFAAVVAGSYLYTVSPESGAQKLVAFLTLGLAMFFAPGLLFKSARDMRDFTVGTVLFGALVAASSLSFSATGANGAEDNPAHIGKGQVIGLAILLLVYTPIRNRWLKAFVLLACIPALAAGLVSAETRGPLFSLAFVIVLSFLLDSFRSPVITRRQMAFVGSALVGSVMLLSAFWFHGAESSKFQYKAQEIVSLLEGNSEARGTAVQRLVYYRAAAELWTERPIAGWGVGGWGMAFWHRDEREYPHNLFLETLVEQGLLGLAALAFFLRSIYRRLRARLSLTRPRFPCLLPGFVYLVSIAMFSGDLDDDRFIWFWCGLVLAAGALAARLSSTSEAPALDTQEADFAAVPAAGDRAIC
jgi:O-antigen ligase